MRKNSTYNDAFRELVDGANKSLVIWNGLSSIQAEIAVGLDVSSCVTKTPCAADTWTKVIVHCTITRVATRSKPSLTTTEWAFFIFNISKGVKA
jgi:hypothetical protein